MTARDRVDIEFHDLMAAMPMSVALDAVPPPPADQVRPRAQKNYTIDVVVDGVRAERWRMNPDGTIKRYIRYRDDGGYDWWEAP